MDLYKPEFVRQMVTHIIIYSEALFRWGLTHKRIELLKTIDKNLFLGMDMLSKEADHTLGTILGCSDATVLSSSQPQVPLSYAPDVEL